MCNQIYILGRFDYTIVTAVFSLYYKDSNSVIILLYNAIIYILYIMARERCKKMKYDVLMGYRVYLGDRLSPATARAYYHRLDQLMEDQNVTDIVGRLDVEKVIGKLSDIKYKNYFSQAKNAFYHFCEYQNISLSDKQVDQIKELESKTRKKYKKGQAIDYKAINKKINHLKNQKLKLSYQTLLSTGLRVFELAQITPNDCILSDDEITFNFIGKGGNDETVKVSKREYPNIYVNLIKTIQKTAPEQKMFYSAVCLQKKAKELGFKCHDIRRIYARLEYKKSKSKDDVREKLRHSSIKTTNIYIKSRIKF